MDLNHICRDDGRQVTLLPEAAEYTCRDVITCHGGTVDQLAALERVAPTGLWVLITGEAGIGKQRWAEHLHRVSGAPGAYVRFDCAATPAARFETALFGKDSVLLGQSFGQVYGEIVVCLGCRLGEQGLRPAYRFFQLDELREGGVHIFKAGYFTRQCRQVGILLQHTHGVPLLYIYRAGVGL